MRRSPGAIVRGFRFSSASSPALVFGRKTQLPCRSTLRERCWAETQCCLGLFPGPFRPRAGSSRKRRRVSRGERIRRLSHMAVLAGSGGCSARVAGVAAGSGNSAGRCRDGTDRHCHCLCWKPPDLFGKVVAFFHFSCWFVFTLFMPVPTITRSRPASCRWSCSWTFRG